MAMLRVSIAKTASVLFVAVGMTTAFAQPPAPTPEGGAGAVEQAPPATLGGCGDCSRLDCDDWDHDCNRRSCLDRLRCARDRARDWYHERHGEDDCYCPLPLGACVNGTMDVQISKGDAAQMVLYHYDFEGDRLTFRGMMQLNKLARMAMETPHPILIQQSYGDEQLDNARRRAVLDILGRTSMPVAEERVLVAMPPARGLDGLDAEVVSDHMLGLSIQGGYRPVDRGYTITGGYSTGTTIDRSEY